MLETVWDLEIKMLIPFDELVLYPDDSRDEYIPDPGFQKIADYLHVQLDIPKLHDDLCKGLCEGKMHPSISVYYADNTYKNFILIDTYLDPTDQLDFILVGIRCTAENGGTIRQYAHDFYKNRCKYNVLYAEGNYVIRDHYNADSSLYKAGINPFKRSVKSHYKQENKDKTLHFFKSGRLI